MHAGLTRRETAPPRGYGHVPAALTHLDLGTHMLSNVRSTIGRA